MPLMNSRSRLPVDPRMRAAAQQAQAAGITLPAQAPGTPFQGLNLNVPMPWGHEGAPLDFHRFQLGLARPAQPAGGMAMGPAGMAHPGPGMAYPGTPGAPRPALGLTEPAVAPTTPTAATQSLGLASGNRLSPQQVLGIASGRYASTGAPSTVGLGLAMRQAAGREGSAISGTDRDRLASRLGPDGTLAPVRPGEGYDRSGMDLKDRMTVASGRLEAATDRRANGFTPSVSGMSPQEAYDKRQFDKRQASLGLAADRQSGKVQTPRQVRMLRDAEAQKQAFEQNLGLSSPGAYANLQQARGAQSLAKSQQDATNAYRTSDLGLRRDALTQQGALAAEREKGSTERARMNAYAHAGGDPNALGLSGTGGGAAQQVPTLSGVLPPQQHEAVRKAAIEDPEKAEKELLSRGVPKDKAKQIVKQMTGDENYDRPLSMHPANPFRWGWEGAKAWDEAGLPNPVHAGIGLLRKGAKVARNAADTAGGAMSAARAIRQILRPSKK